MNSIKVRAIVSLSVLILLSVWLLSADNVVMRCFVPENLRVEKIDGIPRHQIQGYRNITFADVVNETGEDDIYECYTLQGAAFCETFENNDDRTLDGYLVSDTDTYHINLYGSNRPDQYYRFEDYACIQGGLVGFTSRFSTLTLKNGVYDLYVAVKENDIDYGVVNTGAKYVKDKDGFKKYSYGETECIEDSKITLKNVYGSIDSIELKNNAITLKGWTLISGVINAEADVYLEITDMQGNLINTIELKKEERLEIVETFGRPYMKAGFSGTFSTDTLDSGQLYLLSVIEEYDGKYYQGKIYQIGYTTEGVGINFDWQ